MSTIQPMVDDLGGGCVVEHGERGADLDPVHPEACLCGEPYYMACAKYLGMESGREAGLSRVSGGAAHTAGPRPGVLNGDLHESVLTERAGMFRVRCGCGWSSEESKDVLAVEDAHDEHRRSFIKGVGGHPYRRP